MCPPSPTTLETAWHTVRGLRCFARRSAPNAADLPALVLVHGLGVSGDYLLPMAERLAGDFNLLIPDLPGFGRSEKPARVMDVPQLAAHLAEWLPAVGLERAAFLANSLGCQVVARLAATEPRRVERAILVGPTVDRIDHTLTRQLARGFRQFSREPKALWPILVRDYWATGTRELLETFRYALADSAEEHYRQMPMPTLVVRGSRDLIVPGAGRKRSPRCSPTAS